MNERGQFYLDGKLIPYPTLLKAFATPPDDETRGKTVPRWLKVNLPAGAKPTDAVFQFRLRQIAAAADQIGLRHELFPQPAGNRTAETCECRVTTARRSDDGASMHEAPDIPSGLPIRIDRSAARSKHTVLEPENFRGSKFP